MSRSLEKLCTCIRPQAKELLKRAVDELGFEMVTVDVDRTPEQQRHNIAMGVSWTSDSRHLQQAGCNLSHALDVVPRHLIAFKGWAPNHPDWERLGKLGESLGLLWGGRWKQRDCPHFEVKVKHEELLHA